MEKTPGSATKGKPLPLSSGVPVAKTAGIIIKAAKSATSVSRMQIAPAFFERFSFLFKYDAYVHAVPRPIDSEKRACPKAESNRFGVILLKSNVVKKERPAAAPGIVKARIRRVNSKRKRKW